MYNNITIVPFVSYQSAIGRSSPLNLCICRRAYILINNFHNYSSVTPTELQLQTLGLGLKFRPSLKPPPAAQFESQIQDFCRSVRLHHRYANQPEDPDFNPKLYVQSGWNPPREDPDLEEDLYALRQYTKVQRGRSTNR